MDKEEFKRLWLPFTSDFYRLALSILKSESDASDIIQDIYVKLWNTRTELSGIRNCKAYGNTLVRNLCLDRLRRRHPQEEIGQLPADSLGNADSEKQYIDRESVRQVREAMEKLPQAQKELVIMRFFRNMEYDEIAQESGLSPVNIRVQINRARNRIKELIAGKYEKRH